MKPREWTEDEEIYLEYLLYSDEDKEDSYTSAAEFLGVTNRQITSKAHKMRRRGDEVGYIQRPFTPYEIKYIKENYEHTTTDLMAEHLNRTRDVITWKANQLGVKKLQQLKYYDAEIRKLAAEGCYKAEIARKLGLKPKSVGDYINRNDIPCGSAPANKKHTWRDDETIRHHHIAHKTYLK